MRNLAFGYSTRCNIKCDHCVAVEGGAFQTMEFARAQELIGHLSEANVKGISFTAGEPFIYLNEINKLVSLCKQHGMYSRVVTNCLWAKTKEFSDQLVTELKNSGLSQLRLSYSRWHQKNVDRNNVLLAASSCQDVGLDYFISFVTDFTALDDPFEEFLREHQLKFFPEPIIHAGRANSFSNSELLTDYQTNCCPMNPYLAPDLTMYACCDAGAHFTKTNFFRLGNLEDTSIDQLFSLSETSRLFNVIRHSGITAIASFAGYKAREIVRYKKCQLCKKLFDSPDQLAYLQRPDILDRLSKWVR